MRQTQDAFPRVPEAKRGVPGCLGANEAGDQLRQRRVHVGHAEHTLLGRVRDGVPGCGHGHDNDPRVRVDRPPVRLEELHPVRPAHVSLP
jgi:hypothetical protein